jgi:hypothetical protein
MVLLSDLVDVVFLPVKDTAASQVMSFWMPCWVPARIPWMALWMAAMTM